MTTIFEISSTNYEKDKRFLIDALDDLKKRFSVEDGYEISKPVSRFGWTFFKLWLKPILLSTIEEKFSDMINKSKGHKEQEKLTNFLSDFFKSRNCNVKLKLVES